MTGVQTCALPISVFRRKALAKLNGEITSIAGVRSYVRAAITSKGGFIAHVLADQGHLISLSNANALVIVDEEKTSLRDGAEVEILVLDRSSN